MLKNIIRKLVSIYRDLSIRKKFLLLLYVQILVPLILVGFISFRTSANMMQEKSLAYSRDILRMLEIRLKDYINNINNISKELLFDNTIYNILKDEQKTENVLEVYNTKNKVESILKKVIFSREEAQSIFIISNSNAVYSSENNSSRDSIMDIMPYDEILNSLKEKKSNSVWYLDMDGNRVKNIYLARYINNRDDFKPIGVVVILVKKSFIEGVYEELVSEEMENIAILTVDNNEVVSRNPEKTYLKSSSIIKNINGESGCFSDSTSDTFVSFVSMEEPEWKIVTYISKEKLFKDIALLRRWVIVQCILSVIVASVIGILVALDIIKPIKSLVLAMKRIQKGSEDSVKVDEDRKDELGFLTKSFNEMSNEINHLVNWIYREQITRKEAELKALQSQINPHFLFNTLESINWMAQLNNVPDISDMVSALSSLMEVSIGKGGKTITLKEEVSYVENYFSIHKKRFSDKIELRKNISDSILHIKIPKLLIQPLIENAVQHGIGKLRKKGIVCLNVYGDRELLIIEVIDNGMGIKSDDLNFINMLLSMDNNEYFRSLENYERKSIGIENVNRRIKLFYGENYGLNILSRDGSFTKVIMKIPLLYNENNNKSKELPY